MSGMSSDQLHQSTLGIYSSLMNEFNPSLQKLVLLGNRYVQAFQALALTSEAYFSALSKIGERAFHTTSSRLLGDVLIQISESQRRLTGELDGVFCRFSMEVLQEMDNNIRLDRDYISGSRKHYEMEVHNQAAALERQLRRGANQDCSEYLQFLRESHAEALKEEERRYRFLSEKHCALIQSIAHLMNKVGMREEEMRKSREALPLGNIPSRAPSPQGSISRSSGGQYMRARVAHQPGGSNQTLLPFTRGEIITVLVKQPKNGWLFGRADSSSRQGWFPATYVEAMDDPPMTISSGVAMFRRFVPYGDFRAQK
ncbi:brain-specific angiogenesis inhibitor 1-associated protein 2-like protein 2 [Perca flavescens]|uniref:brain-specific angiogenesis inhibitor 1-associated protein 2-like protein 2 n=1 Tax=Perca flavescens TaxID=8167 RepID=UPI00106E07C9|nr:brain-specific angiogenesis inhibitor 1-associated protein 2-like protein 2 [Perca flavescens]